MTKVTLTETRVLPLRSDIPTGTFFYYENYPGVIFMSVLSRFLDSKRPVEVCISSTQQTSPGSWEDRFSCSQKVVVLDAHFFTDDFAPDIKLNQVNV